MEVIKMSEKYTEEQKKIIREYHEKILEIGRINKEAMELLDKL